MAPQLTPIYYVPTAPDAGDPTPSRAIEWTGFHKLVSTVTGAGIAPPPAFVALAEGYGRLQTFASGNGRTMQSRLVEGLISGATGDLEALFAAALIERAVNSGGVIAAELLEEIRGAVLDALRKIYAPTVVRTYRTLAGKFNDTAQAFHRAAATISPAASSDVAAEAPRGVLEAWHDGLRHAKTLEVVGRATILRRRALAAHRGAVRRRRRPGHVHVAVVRRPRRGWAARGLGGLA